MDTYKILNSEQGMLNIEQGARNIEFLNKEEYAIIEVYFIKGINEQTVLDIEKRTRDIELLIMDTL